MFNKKKLIILLVAVVAIVLSILFYFGTKSYPKRININNVIVNVEVVDNAVLMAKGLSGHEPLSELEGMLFVFSSPGLHYFWMKDMTFPLDIIWFDADKKIVHIEKGLSPNTYPKSYFSSEPSLYTLEVNSGFSDKFGLKIGDHFSFVEKDVIKLGF